MMIPSRSGRNPLLQSRRGSTFTFRECVVASTESDVRDPIRCSIQGQGEGGGGGCVVASGRRGGEYIFVRNGARGHASLRTCARRLLCIGERDTSARQLPSTWDVPRTRDLVTGEAPFADRFRATGQHNSRDKPGTAACDARQPYRGYDAARVPFPPPPSPSVLPPGSQLINALIYQLSFRARRGHEDDSRTRRRRPAGALRGACCEGKQGVNRIADRY